MKRLLESSYEDDGKMQENRDMKPENENRRMVPKSEEPVYLGNDMWHIGGEVITDYILFNQRMYRRLNSEYWTRPIDPLPSCSLEREK